MESTPVDGMKAWRTNLPILLLVSAAFALGVAAAIFWLDLRVEPPLNVSILPQFESSAADYLKDRLELYDRRARDLQWLLAALLATGSLFTLLQGLFAYLSVSNFNAGAEASLKKASEAAAKIESSRLNLETEFRGQMERISTDLQTRSEQLRQRLEAQFPVAAQMEQSLYEALRLLDAYFQDADWYESLYAKLRPSQREEILFYEKVIAGFASLSLPRLDEAMARSFRGLGSFYTSKFRHEGLTADLDRAQFYFHRAIRKNPRDFPSMNMLGYIALTCTPKPDFEIAESQFRQSLASAPNQQRARYGLAWIAFNRDSNYSEAASLFREALREKNWELRYNLENETYIRLNLACSLARCWERSGNRKDAEETIEQLQQAIHLGHAFIEEHLRREFAPGGDLEKLASSPEFGPRVPKG